MAITLQDRVSDLLVNQKPNKIGTFTVHDSYASCYRGEPKKKLSERQLEILSQNWGSVDYTGNLSVSTRKKIRSMLTTWSRSIETFNRLHKLTNKKNGRRIVFLTLTLPLAQFHSDNDIKRKVLSKFIIYLLRHSNVKHYFWRAESQKNGNIHFHMLLDSYVHKSIVNYYWDLALSHLGYCKVDVVYNTSYASTTTKIEAPKLNDSIAIYVVKYATKDEGNRLIEGKIWGCSDSLRELERLSYDLSDSDFNHLIVCEKKGRLKIFASAFCDVYVGNVYSILYEFSDDFKYHADCFYYDSYHSLYSDTCLL